MVFNLDVRHLPTPKRIVQVGHDIYVSYDQRESELFATLDGYVTW